MNQKIFEILVNECRIMYGKQDISGDEVLEQYTKFLAEGFFSDDRKVLFTLHTGSLCFDIISILIALLECIYRDIVSDKNSNVDYQTRDIVVYNQQRYKWVGIEERKISDTSQPRSYCVLMQDGKGKNAPTYTYVGEKSKHLIKPYYGSSVRTDGMGLRKKESNREDFLSFLFDIPVNEIPAEVNESAVIICDRDNITDIIKNVSIRYKNQTVHLEDLCPSSYFASTGEEYQIGPNPLKLLPVIRAVKTISTARELVLDRDNNVKSLVVIGASSRDTENTELEDLLNRKALRHINISGILNSAFGNFALNHSEENTIFACMKAFLNQFKIEVNEYESPLITELHNQEQNIAYSTFSSEIVDGGWTWNKYKEIRNKLNGIKNSSWEEQSKKQFVITAYSLINLLNSAAFPMEYMESAIKNNRIHAGVVSPKERIEELRNMSDDAGILCDSCLELIDAIELQYQSEYSENQKLIALKNYIKDYFTNESKIAVVVPKAYYIDLLKPFLISYKMTNVDIVNSNRFNEHKYYDGVLVTGNFRDKVFDPLNCRTAAEVVSFLYDNEKKVFKYKKEKMEETDHKLNSTVGIAIGNDNTENYQNEQKDEIGDDIESFEESDNEIEMMQYFNFDNYLDYQSSSGQSQAFADVTTTATFLTGERILFTKYYKAVVYDSISSKVVEKDPTDINVGDTLVFMSKDSYTKNMVDTIYDQLLNDGVFNQTIVEATEKASYWKNILRDYKENNNLTYRDLANKLRMCGSSVQEMAVRQWISEDSHIVGPRDEKTMVYIEKLTEDAKISVDPSSFFEACKIVRRQRREILKLIGEAITEKLKGNLPKNNTILNDIWENVDNLSMEYEIDSIRNLSDPVSVPIGYVNKPIDKEGDL